MFHIVFESRGAELLSAAMDIDESLDGETVIIRDDYAVGPLEDLFSESGQDARSHWWKQIQSPAGNTASTEMTEVFSDAESVQKMLHRMREEEFDEIWIWIAPNAKDVSGYYWLIAQLKEFAGRIYILSLNNLPFISEKGTVFYPVSLEEIPAREFVKAKKLLRPITTAEFETDPDEWLRLASDHCNLRLLEGGKKIISKEDDSFDKILIGYLQPVFQKITRTLQQFHLKSSIRLNEAFLLWRLKQLVVSNIAEQQGDTVRLFVKEGEQVKG